MSPVSETATATKKPTNAISKAFSPLSLMSILMSAFRPIAAIAIDQSISKIGFSTGVNVSEIFGTKENTRPAAKNAQRNHGV